MTDLVDIVKAAGNEKVSEFENGIKSVLQQKALDAINARRVELTKPLDAEPAEE